MDISNNYNLEVTKNDSYVHIKFCGVLTAENQKKVIEEIFLAIHDSGRKNALIDRRAGPPDPSWSSYDEASFISDLPFVYRFKMAVLVRPEDIEQASFLEAVGANRELNWKFFQDEQEAIEWLTTESWLRERGLTDSIAH